MRPNGRPVDERARRLRQAIDGLRAAGDDSLRLDSLDLTPKSAHEAITRQMVTDLAADLSEIKGRLNTVLWLVAGAVLVDVAMRLVGVG